MKRVTALIALLLLTAFSLPALSGDTLYKWVDAQGNVHYSDKPQPGASKVHLPTPTTFSAPDVTAPRGVASEPQDRSNSVAAPTLEITSPTPDETFWNVQSITVTLAAQPELGPGDTVTITLDDKTQGPSSVTSATFTDLTRGTHTVHAVLHQAAGGTISAKPVTFYIQQATQKHMH